MPMLPGPERLEILRDLAAQPSGAWITVAGRSMEPTLHVGDRVNIRRSAAIRRGDVVLFEARDRTDVILHRVVATLPGVPWFVHIGDGGNPDQPSIASVHSVIGRADLPRRPIRLRTYLATIRRLVCGSRLTPGKEL